MPRFVRMATIAMVAAVMACASGARADDGELSMEAKDAYAMRLFGENYAKQDKAYACFVRSYDAGHLAQHSLQKVSKMVLLITAEKDAEDKTLVSNSFRLGLKFRNRAGNFDSSGGCSRGAASDMAADKLHIGCGVDCDGGGITVEMSNNDKSTLIRLDHIRIWNNNKPDDEGFGLSGGADDRVFRLDRVSNEQCKSLVTDRKELAAMRTK